ncbi:MAG: hypothetical protein QCH99_02405 [Candidatus Bathyarchaeota archaeon]|nr:hypothetical protein [Candidatus Bathyarchaeum tardum]
MPFQKPFLSTLLFILISIFFVSYVGASSVGWSQTFGTEDATMPFSLIETLDGGYAIAGGVQALGVSYDFCLVKTYGNGSMQWINSYGGNSYDMAHSLVSTSDGGYALVGYTESFGAGGPDFLLVKTDSKGSMLWNRTYGGSEWDVAYSLVETSDGGFMIAGYTKSFGVENSDLWLVKTDANGIMEWNRNLGGAANDVAYSLIKSSEGGYAIAGSTQSFGAGGFDCWLIKTDSNGIVHWNQTYGGLGDDHAFSLVETSDGGYALAGMTESFGAGKADVWLIKADIHGNMEWNQTYGGVENDEANSLIQTSDGGYALAGYKTKADATADPFHVEDFWLIKTDGSGKLEWNQTYGDEWDERAQSIIETSDGGFALAGYSLSGPPGGDMKFLAIKTNQQGIIPEFASWTIFPLFLTGVLVVVILRKKL